MSFKNEKEFEEAVINILISKGWEEEVLVNYDEEQLLKNWANILFTNNRDIDRLGDYPLTTTEMKQIVEQIRELKTPINLNKFINGKTVSIVRDNVNDKLHCGKEISLKIYDRNEIAAGQSRYQIVRQPKFYKKHELTSDRRGDLLLLINGMPVIHIELKRSGIPVSQAYNQIEKYSKENMFIDLFSMIQVFVAMTPEESVYFANPGNEGKFNKDYYFHWADFNNNPINKWNEFVASLLSIPMAHQLIGFYTIADNSDGILKVMRSYQYYASSAISDKVAKINWDKANPRGGYVWHTTGSGKTMTSYKSAELIADSNIVDRVVFLTDRIELGVQSSNAYKSFAFVEDDIQTTDNSYDLLNKLKSDNKDICLIITSIQKMSRIKEEEYFNSDDIKKINNKKIVFIIDEAHRSTFGDMLRDIKETFSNAVFFGFTGTPIHDENSKKLSTTADVFGNELHRYSIADGIRDKNVLGFDLYKVTTFKDKDLRNAVALDVLNSTFEEVCNSEEKSKKYYWFMNPDNIKMYGYLNENGEYIKGIEDYINKKQYMQNEDGKSEHQEIVVNDILVNFDVLSHDKKFHAIFATSSIKEAIEYYRLFKSKNSSLKIATQFSPEIDNLGDSEFKEDGLIELLDDYNKSFNKNFTIPTYSNYKKDVALRLAHKEQYKYIDKNKQEQLDLLIVVDQMLTGYDSKWINTLYLDKVLEYENIIQAFSRTNRLFGYDKPHGTIKYYRKPHTMEQNINIAVKSYSGDKVFGLFVDKIKTNIEKINFLYKEIVDIFEKNNIDNMEKLPENSEDKNKIASLFKELNIHLEPAKIQGVKLDKNEYLVDDEKINLELNLSDYNTLLQRYKELPIETSGENDFSEKELKNNAYDLVGYLMEFNTDMINTEYMNSKFDKYLKVLNQEGITKEELETALNQLHKSFSTLSQEYQKYANILIHEIQRGDLVIESGKQFSEYIIELSISEKDKENKEFADNFGLDYNILKSMLDLNLKDYNINEFGRLSQLISTSNDEKVKEYFEQKEKKTLLPFECKMKLDKEVRKYILNYSKNN